MAFNFFTIVQKPNTVLKTVTATYPEAKPAGGSGAIDVHGTFRWKNKGSVDEVPSILLTEYKLNTGARVSNLTNILLGGVKELSNSKSFSDAANTIASTAAKSTFGDPYQGLYIGDATGFHYNLPYLKNSGPIRGEGGSNEWGTNRGLTDVIADMFPNLKEIGSILGSTITGLKDEGFGAEQIYKFTGASARSVTISFPLYNTYSIKEANDNFSFISLFGFQNLRTRTSFYSFLPPKVYTVDTQDEGGVYMPIAVVSSFKVEGIGALRKMSDFGQGTLGVSSTGHRLVPEAYKVTITLKELIPETTNIMQGSLGQNKVQVIGSTASVASSGVFSLGSRSASSSSGTLGEGQEVSYSSEYNPSGQDSDLSNIPLSSSLSNEELRSQPSVTNISGYDPNSSPSPSDPMNLAYVETKNESGYDRNAAASDQDPMELTFRPSSIPKEESNALDSEIEALDSEIFQTREIDQQPRREVENYLENNSDDRALESKVKILEDLANQQYNAESEDEWNQIAATKKAVEDSPLKAFTPEVQEDTSVDISRLLRQQNVNSEIKDNEGRLTLNLETPIEVKRDERPTIDFLDKSSSTENLFSAPQASSSKLDDILTQYREDSTPLKPVELNKTFSFTDETLSTREQAKRVLENNKDLTALSLLANNLNSTKEYIPPMTDFRGPVKVGGNS